MAYWGLVSTTIDSCFLVLDFFLVHPGPSWSILVYLGPFCQKFLSWSILVHLIQSSCLTPKTWPQWTLTFLIQLSFEIQQLYGMGHMISWHDGLMFWCQLCSTRNDKKIRGCCYIPSSRVRLDITFILLQNAQQIRFFCSKLTSTGHNVQLQFQFLRSSEIKAEVVGGLRATWAEITKPPAPLFTDPWWKYWVHLAPSAI